LGLSIAAGAASAQQRPDPFEQLRRQNEQFEQQARQRAERSRAATVATKAEPMPQSLEQLLAAGWIIVSSGFGAPMGTQLIIHMPQRRGWALCDVRVMDGAGNLDDQPASRCVALN